MFSQTPAVVEARSKAFNELLRIIVEGGAASSGEGDDEGTGSDISARSVQTGTSVLLTLRETLEFLGVLD